MISVRYEARTDDHQRGDHHTEYRYRGGDQVVDLDELPDFFPSVTNSGFFRVDRVRRCGISFDTRIEPSYEDGTFCWRYILGSPVPLVGFVRSTSYPYSGESEVDWFFRNGITAPGLYDQVPRFAYLAALETAGQKLGHVPLWLQSFVLSELFWYFQAQDRGFGGPIEVSKEQGEHFLRLLREIRRHIDDAAIESFSSRRYKREWRDILLHGLSGDGWVSPYAVLSDFDGAKNEVRLSYRFVGEAPVERIRVGRRPAKIVASKTRRFVYFGCTLMRERIVWISNKRPFSVELAGQLIGTKMAWSNETPLVRSPSGIADAFESKQGTKAPWLFSALEACRVKQPLDLVRAASGLLDQVRLLLARTPYYRRKYRDAWAIMDRLHDANDSGEILFHYLQANRPDINSWFVIERHTPDWRRLKKSRTSNVLTYDSLQWRLMMLNCSHVISSHLTEAIHRPPNMLRLRKPDWKFTFLQHGVIKDDISRWVNRKKIDLFVTSTGAEHQSIVGDETTYIFTDKEVKRDGLPRFDKLHEAGQRFEGKPKDIVLIAPTSRSWLHDPLRPGSFRREMSEDFENSEFARNWLSLLRSPELHRLAAEHGLKIAVLPHSNIKELFDDPEIAPGCEVVGYERDDIRDFYARSIVFITDYSSAAFNAVFLRRPVIYFQFDRERVIAGGHQGRQGYFDYVENGYGPVTSSIEETLHQVRAIASHNGVPAEPYRSRIENAFNIRDGRCCERVTASIEALCSAPEARGETCGAEATPAAAPHHQPASFTARHLPNERGRV
jgi:CDP-glycerol glycerophosphotransferase (TagB/SpsB family)